mmetsp:Transcript_10559/g.19480  ORF Transcript_10559/g.19480 Transcript_10559/m.19480 type:complete len:410 (-) Transcript_10559:247-1476(-)
MGCFQSKPMPSGTVAAPRNLKRRSVEKSNVSTSHNLMHTNSMLFSSEAMEEAKKSLRMDKPIDWDTPASDEDPDRILTPTDCGYELGMEIEYATDMKESMKLRQDVGEEDPRVLKFGYKTIPGRSASGPSKPNQDSLVAFRIEGHPDKVVFGVFDGHGPFGQFASHFCRVELHKAMVDVYKKNPDASPETVLHESTQHIHNTFNKSDPSVTGVDPQVSGTTLIVALVLKEKIYVANVGDSRCVMGLRSSAKDTKAKVIAMSDDHKPERESEMERISKTDAVLMSEGQLRGGPKEGKTYVCRRDSLGNIVYGVLFSRSIGDLDAHQNLGIESKAEIIKGSIDPSSNQYLVLASDGVWDQMTNEQVMRKVFHTEDPLKASEQIASISRDRWDSDRLHSRRDDISVLVVQVA